MTVKAFLSGFLLLLFPFMASASWLSKITGIDVDVNSGTVRVNPPDPGAIVPMLQHLPKDVAQVALNPYAPVLAEAIRASRAQAINRGVQPIPQQIRQVLAPYFPTAILDKVRWGMAGGISIDGALTNWFNQEGAITFDDVIVFSNGDNAQGAWDLWAHELTHVMQYQNMGIDTFAFNYMIGFSQMEQQARDNAAAVQTAVSRQQQNPQQPSGYNLSVSPQAFGQQLQWDQIQQQAVHVIDPRMCIWIQGGMTGNSCPVTVAVAGIVIRSLFNGVEQVIPCNVPTCIYPPQAQGPLLSPPGWQVIGVTAAFQI